MSRNYFTDFSEGYDWGQKTFVDRPRLLKEHAENRHYEGLTRGHALQDRANRRAATDNVVTAGAEYDPETEHRHELQRRIKQAFFQETNPEKSKPMLMQALNDPLMDGLRTRAFGGPHQIIGGGLGADGKVGLVYADETGARRGYVVDFDLFQEEVLNATMGLDPEYARRLGAEDDAPGPGLRGAPRGGNSDPDLVMRESGGRLDAQNDAVGHGGQRGHFGRVQFGHARLQDAKDAGVLPPGTTPEQFMASAELQDKAEAWHFADIDAFVKQEGLDRYIGAEIGGTVVTAQGLRNVANLGGKNGMRDFVTSGGAYNPADENGTRLLDYLKMGADQGGVPQGVPQPGIHEELPVEPLQEDKRGLDNPNRDFMREGTGTHEDDTPRPLFSLGFDNTRRVLNSASEDIKHSLDGGQYGAAAGHTVRGLSAGLVGIADDLTAPHRGLLSGVGGFARDAAHAALTGEEREEKPAATAGAAAAKEPAVSRPDLDRYRNSEPSAQNSERRSMGREGLAAALGLTGSGQRAGGGSRRPSRKEIEAAGEFLFQGDIGLADFHRYVRTGSLDIPRESAERARFQVLGDGFSYDTRTNTLVNTKAMAAAAGTGEESLEQRNKQLRHDNLVDESALKMIELAGVHESRSGQVLEQQRRAALVAGSSMDAYVRSDEGRAALNVTSRIMDRLNDQGFKLLDWRTWGRGMSYSDATIAHQIAQLGWIEGNDFTNEQATQAANRLNRTFWKPIEAASNRSLRLSEREMLTSIAQGIHSAFGATPEDSTQYVIRLAEENNWDVGEVLKEYKRMQANQAAEHQRGAAQQGTEGLAGG